MKKISVVLLALITIVFLGGCSDDAVGSGKSSSSEIATPTGFGAEAKSSTSVKLKWAPVDGAWQYNIQSNDGYGWTMEGSTSNNEYNVSGLQPYTNYSFRVQAVGSSNTSEWSLTKSARTYIGKPFVQAIKSSSTSVTLIITPVDGAISYSVSYGTTSNYNSSTFYTNAYPVNGSIPDVKISKLTTGKTYYFFVTPIASGTSQVEHATESVLL